MPIVPLMRRSRDAARRAREALAAGNQDAGRHTLAAVTGPLSEIEASADAVRQLQDIEEQLAAVQRRLRALQRNADRPPEVKRRQAALLEAEIAGLKAARRDLEDDIQATLSTPRVESTQLPTQYSGQQVEGTLQANGNSTDSFGESNQSVRASARTNDDALPLESTGTARVADRSPPHPDGARTPDNVDASVAKGKRELSRAKARSRDEWMAGLPHVPLTDVGAVDVEALKTGQVYRIPASAGGGLGRWTNGLFYNYDGEADWDVRSVANLDAYSGASGQLTPEEKWDRLRKKLKSGGDFMPANFLKAPDIDYFNRNVGRGIRAHQGDDVVSFRLGDGPVFLKLPDDAAAVLVRNWNDFGSRVNLLAQMFAEGLSPEDMRRMVEAEVYKGIPESERYKPSAMNPDGTMYAFDDPFGGQRRVADLRMRAFDEMADGIRNGASDEEVARLIRDFQEIMLPELMGAGRFLKEFIKDMVPGLNNARSAYHLRNDLIELKEEWNEGDIAGLAGNSLLFLLDALGLIPIVGSGVAPIRNVLKKGGRSIVRAVPRLDGLVAQAQRWRHGLQWRNLSHKIDPSRIFGTVFDKLPPDIQNKVRSKTNFAFGHAGEDYQQGLLERMDPAAHGQTHVNIPEHLQPTLGGRTFRRYDGLARDATAVLVHDFIEWTRRLTGHRWTGFRAKLKHHEFKTGGAWNNFQELADAFMNNNPGMLTDVFGNAVNEVRRTRIYLEQIPMELAIQHAEDRFAQLVANNVIEASTSRELLDAMRASYEGGTKLIGLFDYVGLYVNLLAAAGHRGQSMPSGDAAETRND